MSIGELFAIKKWLLREQLQTMRRYYKKPRFALIDLSFGFFSFFSNPYRVCRKFLQKRGEEDVYAYGETPFSSLQKIVDECGIESQDRWLELGSGRGKGCFWIAEFVGCKTTGVEWVPQFVFFGRILKSLFRVKNLFFERKNMEMADFSSATVVYLYGTCLQENQIQTLLQKMESLPLGSKVISVSFPLRNNYLIFKNSFSIFFPWGYTQAFLHIKTEGKKYGTKHHTSSTIC